MRILKLHNYKPEAQVLKLHKYQPEAQASGYLRRNPYPSLARRACIETLRIAVLICLVMTVGCELFRGKDTKKPLAEIRLPVPEMKAGSVALEIAVAELDQQQQPLFDRFIRHADQTKLGLYQRKLLDQNGFSVAVLSSTSSEELEGLLSPQTVKPEWLNDRDRELAAAGKLKTKDRFELLRRVEKRNGESFPVEVSPKRPAATWTIYVGDQTQSGNATQATGYFRITAWPRKDGTVRFVFVPEIHHGNKRSFIGVKGSDWAFEERQAEESFPELAFEVTIRYNETILVAPTRNLERLGGLFFNAASIDDQDPKTERETDLSAEELDKFFPMLDEVGESTGGSGHNTHADASVLLEIEDLQEVAASEPPPPWQRLFLLRIIESKPIE
jgi:hypothetical protein